MWEKILTLFFKNPCENCLVVAICNQQYTCKKLTNYNNRRKKTTSTVVSGLVYTITFFVLSTFVLGLYGWYYLLKKLF